MRREFFALHFPNPERVRVDDAVLEDLSRGLSGGDIRNFCLNANRKDWPDPMGENGKPNMGVIQRAEKLWSVGVDEWVPRFVRD